MKKSIKILSIVLAMLMLTNTSVLAFSGVPVDGFDFDIEIIDENTISIRENGEEYIISSVVEDHKIYNYLRDKDGNIIDYTVYDSLKGETYFSTTGETIKIMEANENLEVDEQISTLSHPGSSKNNPVKVCSTVGSKSQQNFKYSYDYILDQTGRVVATGVLVLAFLGLWGISVNVVIGKGKVQAFVAAIIGVITANSSNISYLTSHGVQGTAYKICRLREEVHTTGEFSTWIQDWDIDSISYSQY